MKSDSRNNGGDPNDSLDSWLLLWQRRSRQPAAARTEPDVTAHRRSPPVVRRERSAARSRSRSGPSTPLPASAARLRVSRRPTGVDVKYVEEINDNNEFFGKLRPAVEPPTGRRAPSDPVSDGWLCGCTGSATPRSHYSALAERGSRTRPPSLAHPAADPKREFTVPWQSGMTGLIVCFSWRPAWTRSPTSVTCLGGARSRCSRRRRHRSHDAARAWASTRRRATEGAPPRARRQARGGGLRAGPEVHRQRLHEGPAEGRHLDRPRLVRAMPSRSRGTTRTSGS